jgi:hypothetical protein
VSLQAFYHKSEASLLLFHFHSTGLTGLTGISDLPSVNSPAKVGGAGCFAPVRISDLSHQLSAISH